VKKKGKQLQRAWRRDGWQIWKAFEERLQKKRPISYSRVGKKSTLVTGELRMSLERRKVLE